jgi:WD40 repeat protein
VFGTPTSSFHGYVAFSVDRGEGTHAVWGPTGWSEEFPGYVLAWSPDGEDMAVLHLGPSGRGLAGSMEVLSWPARESTFTTAQTAAVGSVTFSPDGSFLAYQDGGQVHILDLAGGEDQPVGPQFGISRFGWTDAGELVAANADDRTITTFDLDGNPTNEWLDRGDAVATSQDGSTIAVFTVDFAGGPPPMVLIRGGTELEVPIPGRNDRGPQISPNGNAILLFSYLGATETLLLVSP